MIFKYIENFKNHNFNSLFNEKSVKGMIGESPSKLYNIQKYKP